jgi:hypothetical protein
MLAGASIFNGGGKNQALDATILARLIRVPLLIKMSLRHPASFSKDAAAQDVHDLVEVDGLSFLARRRAYLRADHLQPRRDRLTVSIDLKDLDSGNFDRRQVGVRTILPGGFGFETDDRLCASFEC